MNLAPDQPGRSQSPPNGDADRALTNESASGLAPAHIEPRQRWRLLYRRGPASAAMTQRDIGTALDGLLVRSGLPLVPAGRYRSRITFALPLPTGIEGEREPAELYLAERLPVHRVRDALSSDLPPGVELVELFDVWLGEAPLIGRVTGADYRIELHDEIELPTLAAAASGLLASAALPRERQKGSGVVRYDLRPLLEDVGVEASASRRGRATVRTRVRVHPEQGSGRPDEVVAALADRLGQPIEVELVVRERVVLVGE